MMQPITHSDLMVLIDTDLQEELQAVIDKPTTHGIIVLGNLIYIPYGPHHPCKAPADAENANPPATYFYVKENCNGHHDQDRTQVRPDADLPDLPEGDAVRQAVPAGNANAESDRGHQDVGLHRSGPAIACDVVTEDVWIATLMPLCPLVAHIGYRGHVLFDDQRGRPVAAYDPFTGDHYLVSTGG